MVESDELHWSSRGFSRGATKFSTRSLCDDTPRAQGPSDSTRDFLEAAPPSCVWVVVVTDYMKVYHSLLMLLLFRSGT